jgi:hypothetical protein
VNRAEVLLGQGAVAAAAAEAEAALSQYARLGDEIGRAEALRWRGVAQLRTGDTGAAVQSLTDSVRIAARLQARLLEAEGARELGRAHAALGAVGEAQRWIGRAADVFTALGAERDAAEAAAAFEELGGTR